MSESDNKKFRIEFGKRIRESRKNLNMSMKELGEKVDLDESTIQRYEVGKIKTLDIQKAKEIAKALNISEAYLMGWEDNNKNHSNVKEEDAPYTVAAHLPEGVELTQDEQLEIYDYIKFILSKRKE